MPSKNSWPWVRTWEKWSPSSSSLSFCKLQWVRSPRCSGSSDRQFLSPCVQGSQSLWSQQPHPLGSSVQNRSLASVRWYIRTSYFSNGFHLFGGFCLFIICSNWSSKWYMCTWRLVAMVPNLYSFTISSHLLLLSCLLFLSLLPSLSCNLSQKKPPVYLQSHFPSESWLTASSKAPLNMFLCPL